MLCLFLARIAVLLRRLDRPCKPVNKRERKKKKIDEKRKRKESRVTPERLMKMKMTHTLLFYYSLLSFVLQVATKAIFHPRRRQRRKYIPLSRLNWKKRRSEEGVRVPLKTIYHLFAALQRVWYFREVEGQAGTLICIMDIWVSCYFGKSFIGTGFDERTECIYHIFFYSPLQCRIYHYFPFIIIQYNHHEASLVANLIEFDIVFSSLLAR